MESNRYRGSWLQLLHYTTGRKESISWCPIIITYFVPLVIKIAEETLKCILPVVDLAEEHAGEKSASMAKPYSNVAQPKQF